MSDARRSVFTFAGSAVDVTWDQRLCIHVAECTRAREEIFVSGRTPWGDPDRADADTVAEVVERCPSGALAHARTDGGPAESPPAENIIVVANAGPLYVRGDLRIAGASADMAGVRTRAALCRCGLSSNKPFCDNSHEEAGFNDRGAIGAADAPAPGPGGELAITPSPNGPLLIQGAVTLITGAGRRATSTSKTALCRCGQSSNKPFCDGAHNAAGFTTE